jgi:sugar lactone lactonase YvrE
MATLNFFIAFLLLCLLLLQAFTTAEEPCQPFLPPPSAQSVCNKPQWSQHGVTVAGVSGQSGSSSFTLNAPQGIFISQPDDTLYVADTGNHRVMKFALGE